MITLNTQPSELLVQGTDGSLEVVSVFETIQGEGPYAGTPAVFVRLAGCNLQCPGCDTDYTTDRRWVSSEALLKEVQAKRQSGLVVLTGGEPLRQSCRQFILDLDEAGYEIQIETNGTIYRGELIGLYGIVSVVCSPKTPKLASGLLPFIDAYKYVLSADSVDANDGLPTTVLGYDHAIARPHVHFDGDVFVQPADEQDEVKNKVNLEAVLASCLKHGYRLSLQMHKIIGLD